MVPEPFLSPIVLALGMYRAAGLHVWAPPLWVSRRDLLQGFSRRSACLLRSLSFCQAHIAREACALYSLTMFMEHKKPPLKYFGPAQFVALVLVFFLVYYITKQPLIAGIASTICWLIVLIVYDLTAHLKDQRNITVKEVLGHFFFFWWP
jgi:hypothetical protein